MYSSYLEVFLEWISVHKLQQLIILSDIHTPHRVGLLIDFHSIHVEIRTEGDTHLRLRENKHLQSYSTTIMYL